MALSAAALRCSAAKMAERRVCVFWWSLGVEPLLATDKGGQYVSGALSTCSGGVVLTAFSGQVLACLLASVLQLLA